MRLAGKVALISGGARGMGAAEARLFAREGARVIIGDILAAEGQAVEADIKAKGGEAAFVRLDVTSEADWQAAVGLATTRFGALNVLVNNAGIGGWGRIEDTTVEDWTRTMDINAKGVFLGTKAAIPAMRRAGGGSIINISSQLGLVGTDNSSPQYQASKGAVRVLTKTTAMQYARDGIRANSVSPGNTYFEGGIWQNIEKNMPDLYNSTLKVNPTGRFGTAEEVANGVVFLSSPMASRISGTNLVIDGALTVAV
jgi:NAD(P)-dependent dehydrogenase (short-subunit alcohol dehydrogenase family)